MKIIWLRTLASVIALTTVVIGGQAPAIHITSPAPDTLVSGATRLEVRHPVVGAVSDLAVLAHLQLPADETAVIDVPLEVTVDARQATGIEAHRAILP